MPRFFEHDGEALFSARVDSLADDDAVVVRCAEIESRAWRPREEFVRALRKSDHLLWSASDEGVLRGFALASVKDEPGELVISIDEAMVTPELAGRHVVSRLFWAAACGVTALAAERRAKRIVFFALTSSTRLITAFYKYRFLLPEHSFDPSPATVALARAYLARRGLESLDASNVWVRGAFPAGAREGEPEAPDAPVPPGFDSRGRGDALLMIGAIPTAVARPIVLARHAALSMTAKGRSVTLPW